MQIEVWPIGRPIPFARNARKITPENIDSLASLIKEYGFRVPLIVDEEDVIIAGHTRLLAAQKLGLEEVPVHVAKGLTKTQIRGLRISDNRVQQNTKWDYEMLALELGELKDLNYDLKLTAFDDHEIQPLLAAEWNPADLGDLDEDKPEKSGSQEKPELKALYFTEEQLEIMEQGLQALRSDENDEQITMGRACELWAGSYLSESPSHVAQSNEQDEEEPVYEDEPEE